MEQPGRVAAIRFSLRTITAAFFILGAVMLLSRFWETRSWSAVLGSVESIRIVPTGAGEDGSVPGEQYRISIEYSYALSDDEFSGTTLSPYDWVFPSERRARAFLSRYDVTDETRVPVYVDPDDPTRSVLVRSVPWFRLEVIVGSILLIVLPVAVFIYSLIDLVRGGHSRRGDRSRGRFW